MKLTVFLILAAVVQANARTTAQSVSLSEESVSLAKVLGKISRQTGWSFFYDTEDLEGAHPVSVQLKKVPVQQALDKVLSDQPLNYYIQGNTVFITRKPPANNGPIQATPAVQPPPPDIHGHVTDTAGNPLAGASVTIKGTKRVVSTDEKGNFKLPISGRSTLVVSYVGFIPQEITMSGTQTTYTLSIVLRHGDSPLDAVEVIAYGTDTRRFSVGSTATITAKDIEQAPVTNVLQVLQGLAPGVTALNTSGGPGSTVQIQVRGQNSLRTNSGDRFGPYDQPLFIVDGVPFAAQNNNLNSMVSLAGGNGSYTNGMSYYAGLSPFNSINPKDIESVTILKDADATSIYGSQGANGVVLITTKKGKAGKLALDLSVNTTINATARPIKMLNTDQYLALRKEAVANDGITLSPSLASSFPDLLVFDQNKSTDWYHQFFGKTASSTDVHAGLSGGTGNTTFIASVGYTNVGYNFPGNYKDDRFTFHGALHHASPNNRFTLDLGSDIGYEANNSSGAPNLMEAYVLPPNLPDLVDPSGQLVWSYDGVSLAQQQQYGYMKQVSYLHTINNNTYLQMAYKVASGLSLAVNAGFSRVTTNEYSDNPLAAQAPGPYTISSAELRTGDQQTINIEPQLHYSHSLGKGLVTALVGGTYKKNINSGTNENGEEFSNDNLLGSIGAASIVNASNSSGYYKYDAVFGRVNYIYNQEYILNLTARRDGSSNFGPGRQFGNFGSAGLGWIFSEEKGFKRLFPHVSYAKLSGNYGTNGSDGVAPYQYDSYWQPGAYTYQNIRPYNPVNLFNPDYSWAVKKSWNASLDLGFFHDRLLFNATAYLGRTSNQLVNYPLPSQTGFNQVTENLEATVQNKGLEFTLTSNNINTKNVKWSTSFNISTNRNTLIAFPGLATSSYASKYTIGKSTAEVIGFRYKDLNPTTGLFEFYNAKGAVTSTNMNYAAISAGGDEQPIVDPVMRFYGGLRNTISYKGLSLTVLFSFADQIAQNYLYQVYSMYPGGMNNQITQVLNHWKKPGDVSALEKVTTGYTRSDAYNAASYFTSSSGAYGDDFYIRLKTLSLTYALPPSFLRRIRMQAGNIFCNTENLLTFTNYKVGDPETPGTFYSIPLQRTVALGLSLDF